MCSPVEFVWDNEESDSCGSRRSNSRFQNQGAAQARSFTFSSKSQFRRNGSRIKHYIIRPKETNAHFILTLTLVLNGPYIYSLQLGGWVSVSGMAMA
jgi:hypothetical protein